MIFTPLPTTIEDKTQPCTSESRVLAAFSGGLNPHLQSAAECGPFAWLNNIVCKIPAFGSSVLLKFLTYQSLVGDENNTFAKSDIREAFVNLHFVEFLSHPSFPEELPALPV